MEDLRQLEANKKCFDCHQKGTMYVVMNFGVFICSNCSGIHREMNHKVKGINMCNFTEVELAFLIENGNAVRLISSCLTLFKEPTTKTYG